MKETVTEISWGRKLSLGNGEILVIAELDNTLLFRGIYLEIRNNESKQVGVDLDRENLELLIDILNEALKKVVENARTKNIHKNRE